jgi:hypothetical protein
MIPFAEGGELMKKRLLPMTMGVPPKELGAESGSPDQVAV